MATFDDDDKCLLTNMIQRAFRSQRMGNQTDVKTQLRLIETYYGVSTRNCVVKSLREDRRFVLSHPVGMAG